LKKIVLLLIIVCAAKTNHAQKIDSLYFNLYTDSLKKGTWNYINVDGKLSNGSYLPLTNKQLMFKASCGEFERNNLWIGKDFKRDSVVVTISLKENPSVTKSITIYIKKKENEDRLKTNEEILNEIKRQPSTRKKKSKGL
jgi:hypothetical protein